MIRQSGHAPGIGAMMLCVSQSCRHAPQIGRGEAAPVADFMRVAAILSMLFAGCLTAKAAAGTAGVGIFDTLFIAAKGTFSIKGNLYLQESEVLGDGSLTLNGDAPQQIVSHNSQVMNLDIANPGLVTLNGDLRINHSLTVNKGTLNALNADLDLCDSAQIKLLAGAKLHARPELIAGLRLPAATLPRMIISAEAVLPGECKIKQVSYHNQPVGHHESNARQHSAVNLEVAFPPPEKVTIC